jgi:hypothetical protein
VVNKNRLALLQIDLVKEAALSTHLEPSNVVSGML